MANLSDRYYSGREVQRKLNITEPALRNLVNQKRLRKVTPPGRKNGVYLKEEVDTYAEKWFAFLTAEEPPKTIFELAKPEDMEMVYNVAHRATKKATISAEIRCEWLAKNPESCYIVRHGKKVVAFFHLLPVKHQTIVDFMGGTIRGWDLRADVIELFEPGHPLECLTFIASEPDIDETTRKHYVRILVKGTLEELRKLGERGVILSTIYATSETPTGIAMAIHAGMQDLGTRLGKRLTFVLDMQTTQSFLADSYKEGFAKWKKEGAKQQTS